MIFGIGLSKTGTTSLFSALHRLGYRAATYPHLRNLGLQGWFRGHFEKDYLDGYDAAVDIPIGVYYPQLDRRYPQSRFILTVRNLDSWLTSAHRHFTVDANPPTGFKRDVRLAAYGVTSFDEGRFRCVYERHLQNTLSYFSARQDDLLVLDIVAGDGWDKLCPFLGCEPPSIPFPHVQPWQLSRRIDLVSGPVAPHGRTKRVLRTVSKCLGM